MNYDPDKLGSLALNRSVFNGYSKSQVDDVLSKIMEDYTQSSKEIEELKSRVSELSDAAQHYKSLEESMQHCFILAQHASDEMKSIASEKAKNIINEAENTSQKMVNEANLEVSRLNITYDDIKNKIFTFKTKTVALLNAELDVINQMTDTNA